MSDENPYAPPEADVEVAETNHNELASRWARLGGAIIDGLVGAVFFWTAIFGFGIWERMSTGLNTYSDNIFISFLWLAIYLLLNGYLLATRGQTIGKVAAGTRIVSIEDGRILPLWKLVMLRIAPFIALGMIPVIGQVIGLLNPLFIFAENRRCLHDHFAGTKVIVATTVAR